MKTWMIGAMLMTLALGLGADGVRAETKRTGFLVVAPDRGFLGNREIQTVFEEFAKSYAPASLAWVGRDDNGVGTAYSSYLTRGVKTLTDAGATEIVAIPLFLSNGDPVLQHVIAHVPAYAATGAIRWAPPMVASYLTGQILLDRIDALSRDPAQERLFVIGVGAANEASEAAIKADLERLLSYATHRKRLREARVVVYYDREAAGAEQKNKAVDASITEAAAKKGRTLVVLATMGPKFDQHMALTVWIGQKFKELNVLYDGEELLPHPNVLLWLKKTANAYVPVAPADTGVVIMPHGATQPWNDAVEQVIAPLKSRYRIELAYGMADPDVIQQAVSRLEQQGARRIVFVRMYALTHHLKDRTDYILGLSDSPTLHGHGGEHDRDAALPAQVRSAALFATFGGYEEYPAIAEVLHERILEISRDPANETVILLAHGEKTDAGDAKWLAAMQANIERLKQDPHCARLKAIRAATVREDWPELREKAVAETRGMIQEGARTGRVLVIANRLYGSGPYKKLLNGLDYVMNEKGLSHPVLTRWVEEGIAQAFLPLTNPLEPGEHSVHQ